LKEKRDEGTSYEKVEIFWPHELLKVRWKIITVVMVNDVAWKCCAHYVWIRGPEEVGSYRSPISQSCFRSSPNWKIPVPTGKSQNRWFINVMTFKTHFRIQLYSLWTSFAE
jgi:hypothetical protein